MHAHRTYIIGCITGRLCVPVQVAEMKKVVEQKQVVVSQAKTDCEELLVQIVQDKRVADEQEKQVRAGPWRQALCRWECRQLTG